MARQVKARADVSALGYAALKPVLIDNEVYGFLCEDGKGYCKASDIRMNFMFTLATVVTNVSPSLPNRCRIVTYDQR